MESSPNLDDSQPCCLSLLIRNVRWDVSLSEQHGVDEIPAQTPYLRTVSRGVFDNALQSNDIVCVASKVEV